MVGRLPKKESTSPAVPETVPVPANPKPAEGEAEIRLYFAHQSKHKPHSKHCGKLIEIQNGEFVEEDTVAKKENHLPAGQEWSNQSPDLRRLKS